MHLYVIAAQPEGPCKIGITNDVVKRLRTLQTGHPETLQVYHSEPIHVDHVRGTEKILHQEMNYKRVRGEWFNMTVQEASDLVTFFAIRYGEDYTTRSAK